MRLASRLIYLLLAEKSTAVSTRGGRGAGTPKGLLKRCRGVFVITDRHSLTHFPVLRTISCASDERVGT